MQAVKLRGWQEEAFLQYQETLGRGEQASLWEATPGAGKTTAALYVLKDLLKKKLVESALIVVPTSHLRLQWARSAARMGIHLDSSFGGKRTSLTSEFHGAVVTYQQFGNRIRLFRDLASRSGVILDEVHHVGDGLTWGKSLRASLEPAKFILCLSGTAFRSDCNAIPFVRYGKDGMSIPDYTYSYSRAVEEKVCRPTAFFTYGGEVSWTENGRVGAATFSDALDAVNSARRLRAALDPDSGWIQLLLKDADAMLNSVRIEHPRAGGLLVCADQTHSRQVAKLLTLITGERPCVVLSDDSGASKKIKEFSSGTSKWLVACNMVSEGVDIPRLRIGVYATTVRTKMYFRQFLGRVVRREADIPGHQVAYVYLPADPCLHEFAQEVESETRHLLNAPNRKERDAELDRSADREKVNTWSPLSSVNSGVDAVILHGNQLTLFGGMFQPEEAKSLINQELDSRLELPLTKSEKKQELATTIKHLVGVLHKRSGQPHSVIHTTLNKRQSVRSQAHCTEKQLQDRVHLLEAMVKGADKKRDTRNSLSPL